MIPLAIARGIIEDKIANDLTGNKTTKEHLEDIKHKLINYKAKPKKVSILFIDGMESVRPADLVQTNNGFVKLTSDGMTEYLNASIIKAIKVEDYEDSEL